MERQMLRTMPGLSPMIRESNIIVFGTECDQPRVNRYRTPLCVLYPPRVIAAACYVLAQHVVDGPESPLSLSARISSPAPSAFLPTPPSQNPMSSESSRFAMEFFRFNEVEMASIAGMFADQL